MALRRAEWDDMALLFQWVNDPDVRLASHNTGIISESEHADWFQKRLSGPDSTIFILEIEYQPAGQIRFDKTQHEKTYEIDFSIALNFRGRGLGRDLLLQGIEAHSVWLSGPLTYVASVKAENLASQRSFESAGFKIEDRTAKPLIYRKNVTGKA